MDSIIDTTRQVSSDLDNSSIALDRKHKLLSDLSNELTAYLSSVGIGPPRSQVSLELGYAEEQRPIALGRYKWKVVFSSIAFPPIPSSKPPSLRISRLTSLRTSKILHKVELTTSVKVHEMLDYGDIRVIVQHSQGYIELRFESPSSSARFRKGIEEAISTTAPEVTWSQIPSPREGEGDLLGLSDMDEVEEVVEERSSSYFNGEDNDLEAPADPNTPSSPKTRRKSLKELIAVAREGGIDTSGMLDRGELEQALRKSQSTASSSAAPSPSPSPAVPPRRPFARPPAESPSRPFARPPPKARSPAPPSAPAPKSPLQPSTTSKDIFDQMETIKLQRQRRSEWDALQEKRNSWEVQQRERLQHERQQQEEATRHERQRQYEAQQEEAARQEQQPVISAQGIKRSLRRVRFFLHPDKLPPNLDEAQGMLCKSLWTIISEVEEAWKRTAGVD
ncbi:hypothetical protein TrST_g5782 [Triparma strigata]|uniref:Uncharacterized protein n=1 Tax=Triparma strigata TaxID=1606541 RepID=A0A9W7EY13_9STRA|nr:hypothetical protein TrST_g5782 [Triparma strigata]